MGVCEGECMGHCLKDEPLTLTRCYNCEMPQPYEALELQKFICGQAHTEEHKEESFFFHDFRFYLSSTFTHFMA